ncbi:MAG: DUF5652 family protein [Dehalobacterium sp.]|jgi:hypothetical protein
MNELIAFFDANPVLLALLLVWSLIWKGLALWHAARNRQLPWFVVLLIVNTVGLLEILYLLFFRKKNKWYY